MLNQVNTIIVEVERGIDQVTNRESETNLPHWMLFIVIIIALRSGNQPEVKLLNRFITIAGFVIVVAILAVIGAEDLIPLLGFPW
jgi:hypothetical protein